MKAKVAVATVQGKIYFLAVNELKQRNIPFVSLIPGQPVPAEVKVVITTKKEQQSVDFEEKLVFSDEADLEEVMSKLTQILQGKKAYEKIVIGVDPGEVFGLVAIFDGKVNEKENFYNIHEIVLKTKKILKNIDFVSTNVTMKIGNGVPAYKELIAALDEALPIQVNLEVVGEAGSNLPLNKRSRSIRHISSAMRIASRSGYFYPRRKIIEKNS